MTTSPPPVLSLTPELKCSLRERIESSLIRLITKNSETIFFRDSTLLSDFRRANTHSKDTQMRFLFLHMMNIGHSSLGSSTSRHALHPLSVICFLQASRILLLNLLAHLDQNSNFSLDIPTPKVHLMFPMASDIASSSTLVLRAFWTSLAKGARMNGGFP
ncbi:hypothetical protein K443DRAFT_377572 [Laccaria amethystina LaAM-08-1]|uniref:Unplaced genomic scaffold K443scaffold_286, whole genome shotgun sequence n=1 Tax=Laccaria amethystina LaAM-08-1 TaxID=1095629 RepID=A0A0C9X8A3_9AGAR|nr:hypothetical protein K443DRAFT_377572 [Laccaria amethystina LaAM-08-1]